MEKQSETKIDRVYEWVKTQKITFVDKDKKANKENNSSGSWKDYCEDMKQFEKWLQNTHGLKDITRAKPKHGIQYMQEMIDKHERKERGGSAFTINRFPHALHSLQSLARASGVYRGLKLGNKQDLLDMKNKAGVVRRSSESTCLKATATDFQKVKDEILKSKSPQKQLFSEIQQIQRGVGCRIDEAMKMKKEHITHHKDGTATIYIKGKGGLERWVEVKDKQTVELIKEKTDDKKDGAYVFQVKNRQGDDKKRSSAIRQVQEVVSAAAERAKVNTDKATYSTHSARKVYAQERVNEYAAQSTRQLERELARRIREYPTDKNGYNKLKDKKDSELQQLRNKIHLTIPGKRTKQQGEELRKNREFTHKELCLFLASIDTGHFRISIMRYYCDYPKDKKK